MTRAARRVCSSFSISPLGCSGPFTAEQLSHDSAEQDLSDRRQQHGDGLVVGDALAVVGTRSLCRARRSSIAVIKLVARPLRAEHAAPGRCGGGGSLSGAAAPAEE